MADEVTRFPLPATQYPSPDSYCWCGHLLHSHYETVDGVIQCHGLMPIGAARRCGCDAYVPVEVATFRMAEAIHNQILDFKMTFAVAAKIVTAAEEPLIKKPN